MSGLKLRHTSSDSRAETLIPKYLIVSVEDGIGGGKAVRFQLFFLKL